MRFSPGRLGFWAWHAKSIGATLKAAHMCFKLVHFGIEVRRGQSKGFSVVQAPSDPPQTAAFDDLEINPIATLTQPPGLCIIPAISS